MSWTRRVATSAFLCGTWSISFRQAPKRPNNQTYEGGRDDAFAFFLEENLKQNSETSIPEYVFPTTWDPTTVWAECIFILEISGV